MVQSPGGLHAYWILDEPVETAELHRIAAAHLLDHGERKVALVPRSVGADSIVRSDANLIAPALQHLAGIMGLPLMQDFMMKITPWFNRHIQKGICSIILSTAILSSGITVQSWMNQPVLN